MGSIQLTKEQHQMYATKVQPMVKAAAEMTIRCEEDNLQCQQFVLNIKEERKRVYTVFHKPVQAAHKAWQEAKALENYFVKPYDDAERCAKQKSALFVQAEEAKARKAAAAAEAERQAKERREREKLEERARKAEVNGKTEKAEQLREQAENTYVPPSQPAPEAPAKQSGISYRDKWRGEVTDPFAILKEIIEKRAPINLIEFNQGALDKFADICKDTMEVPGLKFKVEKIMSGRA